MEISEMPNAGTSLTVNSDTSSKEEEESSEWLSGKFLVLLVLVYAVFIVLGGIFFHLIEYSSEEESRLVLRDKIAAFLGEF